MERKNKFSEDQIQKLVQAILCDADNVCKMLQKHKQNMFLIDHGQLHIDHDDRSYTGWNDDLLKLFPLWRPVVMTTWKGHVAVHFLDENHYFGEVGTREALEYVLSVYGYEPEMLKRMEEYHIK